MDTLWTFSTSEFRWLYAALLLAPALIGHLWAERQRRAITLSAPVSPVPTQYQLAWLLGGLRRAVETAVATLIERGALHPSPQGILRITREARQPADPFERAVQANAHEVKVGELTTRMRTDPGHVELRRSVENAGLAVPHEWATKRRIVVAGLYTAVLGLGIARLIASLDAGIAVDNYLIALLGVAAIADVLATLAVVRRGPKTRRGAQAILDARPTARAPGRAPTHGFGLSGAPAAVLFGGLAVYPDRSVQDAFGYYRRPGLSGDGWSVDGDGGGCDGD